MMARRLRGRHWVRAADATELCRARETAVWSPGQAATAANRKVVLSETLPGWPWTVAYIVRHDRTLSSVKASALHRWIAGMLSRSHVTLTCCTGLHRHAKLAALKLKVTSTSCRRCVYMRLCRASKALHDLLASICGVCGQLKRAWCAVPHCQKAAYDRVHQRAGTTPR